MAAFPQSLLDWHDPFTMLNTREAGFDKVFKPAQEETVGLELVRAADALRRTTVCKHGLGAEGLPDQPFVDRLLQYLGELEAMVSKVEGDGTVTGLATSWTSPIAGKPSHFHKLTGLASELAMAACQYAAALRSLAVHMLQLAASPSTSTSGTAATGAAAEAGDAAVTGAGGGEGPGVAAQASTLLRKAAGVYQWMQDRGIPRVASRLPTERPAELSPAMAKVMAQVCLAEAQTVAAVRAEQRAVSAGLLASLHAGAWELWEGCAKVLKASTGEVVSISDHLRRYIACSSAICRARALRALAVDLRDGKQQAGQAEAACLQAATLVSQANVAADMHASWRKLGGIESAVLEETRKKCEKERTQVLYQAVARSAPDLPPGKVLGAAIPFVLEPPVGALQEAAQQEGSALAASLASPTAANQAGSNADGLVVEGLVGAAPPGSSPPGGGGGRISGAGGLLGSPIGRASSSALTSALDHSLSIREHK